MFRNRLCGVRFALRAQLYVYKKENGEVLPRTECIHIKRNECDIHEFINGVAGMNYILQRFSRELRSGRIMESCGVCLVIVDLKDQSVSYFFCPSWCPQVKQWFAILYITICKSYNLQFHTIHTSVRQGTPRRHIAVSLFFLAAIRH